MGRVGCYSTARVSGGRIERLERHAGRLRRDATRLGLASPSRRAIEDLALAITRAELAHGDGALRLEWSAEGSDPPALTATTRPLGSESDRWRARTARAIHPGAGGRENAKVIEVPAYDAARTEQTEAGVDECLLYDADGRLVEGGRTNLILATHDGRWLTPARSLGAVEGLGLECVREAVPEIRESTAIDRKEVAAARELIAVNAVRGAVAVIELDGAPIGDGQPGPLAIRLRGLFFRK